jgi:hypothetical protein
VNLWQQIQCCSLNNGYTVNKFQNKDCQKNVDNKVQNLNLLEGSTLLLLLSVNNLALEDTVGEDVKQFAACFQHGTVQYNQ